MAHPTLEYVLATLDEFAARRALLLRRVLHRTPDYRERNHPATIFPIQEPGRRDHSRRHSGDYQRRCRGTALAALRTHRSRIPRRGLSSRTFDPVRGW